MQLVRLLVAFAVFVPVGVANVYVVAPSGGTHTTIQSAVDQAQDGDAIVVRAGTYPRFVVDGKALAIVAELGHVVSIVGSVEVRNLGAGETAVLVGLDAAGTTPTDTDVAHGFLARANAGRVRVQNCNFRGLVSSLAGPTECSDGGCNAAVRVEGTLEVTLIASSALGGAVGTSSGSAVTRGARGVDVRFSKLVLYDSFVFGGDGFDADICGFPLDGGHGGDGCWSSNSLVLASGSILRGGAGGRTYGGSCIGGGAYGGDGGDAIELAAPAGSSNAHLHSVDLAGGSGGIASTSVCGTCSYAGIPGWQRRGTAFHDIPGAARKLFVPCPVREETQVAFEFEGLPGESIGLLISQVPSGPLVLPAWFGFLLVPRTTPPLMQLIGITGTDGRLVVTLPMPTLETGESFRTYHLQPVFVDSQQRLHLGTPRILIVLDSAI